MGSKRPPPPPLEAAPALGNAASHPGQETESELRPQVKTHQLPLVKRCPPRGGERAIRGGGVSSCSPRAQSISVA